MTAGTYEQIWSPVRTEESWHARLWATMRAKLYRLSSDETLVRRAHARDHAAFEALVARYRKRLYTMALRSLGNEGEAGEAMCEMVLEAFKDIESFGAKCSPGTWLYLHGFRAVFKRMNLPAGKYVFENRASW